MSEAAVNAPYSAEYLSLLARKGKLTAKKINNAWYTTQSILDEYMKKQMIRAQVQNGNFNGTPVSSVDQDESIKQLRSLRGDTREYLKEYEDFLVQNKIQKSAGISPLKRPTPTSTFLGFIPNMIQSQIIIPLKNIFHRNVQTESKPQTSPVTKTPSPTTTPEQMFAPITSEIESALERVIDRKFNGGNSNQNPNQNKSGRISSSARTVFSSKTLVAATILCILVLTIFPIPLVFSFFEKSVDFVKSSLVDSNTVMGFRPGTHANEILLLSKNGNISIMGHIETEGQFRSFAPDGTAPIVVDSKTMVKNLNAEYLGGASSTEFTLAFVTKNGSVTTEDVTFGGSVEVGETLEVGQTLVVKGATKLLSSLEVDGNTRVLGNAEFGQILKVLGPAYFEGLVTMKDNLSVNKNLSVRGSITSGSSVIAKNGSFGSLGVSGDTALNDFTADDGVIDNATSTNFFASKFNAVVASITSLVANDITVNGLTATNSTTTNATTTNLSVTKGSFATLCLDADVCRTTWPISSGANSKFATSTNLMALFPNGGTNIGLVIGGTATTTNSLFEVTGGAFFDRSTTTSATTTNLFFTTSTGGTQTLSGLLTTASLLLNGSSTLQNFTFQNATGTSATTTNFFSTNGTFTNLFSTTATSTNLFSTNGNIGTLTVGPVTSGLINGQTISSVANFTGSVGIGTTLTAIGGLTNLSNLLLNGSSTLQNFTFNNATGTSATTTNFFSTTLFSTTASSTNLFSNNSTIGNLIAGSLSSGPATLTTLLATSSTTLQNFTGINSTTTSATSTNFFSTNLTGTNINFSNILFVNATGTNATTTNFFSTNGTFTNLFSTTANLTESGNLFYTDTRVNTYINASTTIPKTYTSNTFTSAQIFDLITRSTTTQATTTNLFSTNGTFTNFFSTTNTLTNLLVNGSTTLQNFTFLNATGTSATTTNLYTSGQTILAGASGNVGIGTTDPHGLLDVRNGFLRVSGSTNTSGVIALGNYTEASNYFDNGIFRGDIGSTATGSFLNFASYSGLVFNTSTAAGGSQTTRMFISNAGNIGIGAGNTSPNGLVDVRGGMFRVSGASNTTGVIALGNYADANGYFDNGIFRGDIGSTALGNYLNLTSYSGIVFNTSTAAGGSQATRMFINGTTGNVGIGTTNPNFKLEVNGTASTTNLFATNATSTYATSTNFYTSGQTILAGAGGKVGIGTANPGTTLDVTGAIRLSSTLTVSGITGCVGAQALQTNGSGDIACGTIATGGVSTGGGWTTNNIGQIFLATTTDQVAVGASSSPYAKFTILSSNTASTTLVLVPASAQTANILDIYNSSGALSSVVAASGRFGIGTTNPQAKLDVNSFDGTYDQISAIFHAGENWTNAFNRLQMRSGAGNGIVKTEFVTAVATAGAGADLRIRVADASDVLQDRFTIQAGGNVGIGTINPNFRLEVNGTASTTNLFATNATTTNLFSTTASSTNLFSTNSNIGVVTSGLINGQNISSTANFTGTLTATGGLTTLSNLLVNGSTTLQNLTFINATGTSATTTNFYSTTASSTNLFSTNSNLGVVTSGLINGQNISSVANFTGTLTATGGLTTLSNLLVNGSTTLQNFTGINATTTNATTTNLFASTAVFTNIYGTTQTLSNLLVTGSTTLQNFTFVNATGSAATTTNFYTSGQTVLAGTSGNVGIGATNPLAKLSVNAYNGTYDQISAIFHAGENWTGGFNRIQMRSGTGNGIVKTEFTDAIGNAGAGADLRIRVADASDVLQDRFTILAGGNVGIGTISPNFRLEINGTASTTNLFATNATTTNLFSTTASSTNLFSTNSNLGVVTSGLINGQTISSNANFTNSLTTVNLTVTGSTTIQNLNSVNSTTTNATSSTLYVSGQTILAATSGKVGIGTTNPIALLHTSYASSGLVPRLYSDNSWPQFPNTLQNVSASITTNDTTVATGPVIGLNLENSSQTNNTYSPLVTFSRKSASGSYNSTYASIGGVATGNGASTDWIAGDLVFGTANSLGPIERMRILGGGNVGIGTSAPNAKLDVYGGAVGQSTALVSARGRANSFEWGHANGTGYLATLGYLSSAGNPYLAFNGESGTIADTFKTRGIKSSIIMSDLSGGLRFGNVGTAAATDNQDFVPLITMLSSGNFGIGTTNPNYKLEVYGTASTTNFSAINATTTFATSTNLYVSGTTTLAGISGRVGIGTTNPLAKLDVNAFDGTYDQISAIFHAGENWTGGFNRIQMRSGTGNGIVKTEFTDAIGNAGAGADLRIRVADASDVLQDRFTILAGGNIGIGTITPTAFKLEVAGNVGPEADNTRDLGAVAKRWANLYVTNLSFTNEIAANSTTTNATSTNLAVTGAFYPNYLTQGSVPFIGASGLLTQNNSQFFWDATNSRLGIGTVAPATRLDVKSAAANSYFSSFLPSAGSGFMKFYQDSNNQLSLYGANAAGTVNIVLNTSGVSYLNGGNLMLGSTADNGNKLQVTGTGYFSGNVGIGTTNPQQKLVVSTGAVGLEVVPAGTGGTLVLQSYDRVAGAYGNLGFDTNTTGGRTMTLLTNGNVGIGTTSPSAKLDVYNVAGVANGIMITGNDAANALVTLKNVLSTNQNLWSIRAGITSISQDGFSIYDNNASASRLVINTSGNVGIGTTSPATLLHIKGTTPTLRIEGARKYDLRLDADVSGQFDIADMTTGVARLVINPSGNVGIGTTGPTTAWSKTLQVYSSSNADLSVKTDANEWHMVSDANGGLFFTNNPSYTRRVYFQSNGDIGLGGTITSDTALTGASMVIKSGNVGIGTTTPVSKLAITGQGTNGGLHVENTAGAAAFSPFVSMGANTYSSALGTFRFQDKTASQPSPSFIWDVTDNSGTVLAYDFQGNGSSRLAITQSGDVGIGDISPGTKLSVNGIIGVGVDEIPIQETNFGFSSSYKVLRFGLDTTVRSLALNVDPLTVVGGNFTGTGQILIGNKAILAPNAAGTDWFGVLRATSTKVYLGGSLSSGEMIGDGLVVSGTSVGIGTTGPGAKLEVNSTGTGAVVDQLILARSDYGVPGGGTRIRLGTQYGDGSSYITSQNPTGNKATLQLQTQSATSGVLNTGIFLNGDGNVGIGTTTPGALLHVEGGPAVLAQFRQTSATNGYGVIIESEGTAATRYALTLRNLAGNVEYGGVSTATGQVGYWGIGAAPSGTLGSRLTVNGGVSVGSSYTATASPADGMIIQGNVGIGLPAPDSRLHVRGGDFKVDNASNVAALFVQQSTGNVGVGTTAPGALLQVGGTASSQRFLQINSNGQISATFNDNSSAAGLTLINTQNAADVGQNITFTLGYGGAAGTAGTNVTAGKIALLAEQNFTSTASTQDSYMALSTALDGTLAEKVRITSTGNVGIGTASPLGKLHVGGGTDANIYQYIQSDSRTWLTGLGQAGGDDNYILQDVTAGITRFRADTSGNIYLGGSAAASAGTMAVLNSGNVGIGTAAPDEKLTVNGAIRVTSNANNFNTQTSGIIDYYSNNLRIAAGAPAATTNGITFVTTNSGTNVTAMQILGSGNVGIGTTTPGQKLEIIGGNANSVKIGRDSDSGLAAGDYQQLLFSTRLSGDYLTAVRSIQANASGVGLYLNPRLGFFVQNTDTSGIGSMTEKVSILGNGNVGIGTTNPSQKLEVSGIGRFTGTNAFSVGGDTGFARIQYDLPNTAFGFLTAANSYAGLKARSLAIGSAFGDVVPPSSGAIIEGNVGIGTTTPTAKLDVNGTIAVTGGSQITANNGIQMFFSSNAGTISASESGVANRQLTIQGHPLIFQANGSEAMRIISGGNVGIGTTNPINAKLQVHNDSSGAVTMALALGNMGATANGTGSKIRFIANRALGDTQDFSYITSVVTDNTTSSEDGRLTMGTMVNGTLTDTLNVWGGNVGIGTTNPNSRLHVKAGVQGEVAAFDNSATTGSWLALKRNGTDVGYLQWDVTDGGGAGGNSLLLTNSNSAAGANMVFQTSGSVSHLVLQKGGNVGIGTTAPVSELHVNGGATQSDVYITNTASGLTTGDGLQVGLASDASSAYMWLYENAPLRFATNGTEKFRIAADGNVGIGTTNPGYHLDVAQNQSTTNPVRIYDTRAQAINQGGFIDLAGYSDNAATVLTTFGEIKAGKTNGTTGDTSGFLSLYANTGSGLGEGIRIISNGNVGIGTTGPEAALDVRGIGQVRRDVNDAGAPNIFVVSNRDTTATTLHQGALSFQLARTGDATARAGANINIGKEQEWTATTTTNDAFLAFGTALDGSVDERVRITSAGNVGIGTTAPGEKLEVKGNILMATDASYGGFIKGLDANHGIFLREGGNVNNYYEYGGTLASGAGHRFLTGGVKASQTLKMQIADDGIYMLGNVGIGTTTPQQKLVIQAPSDALALSIAGRTTGQEEGWFRFYRNNGTTMQGGILGSNNVGLTLSGPSGTNDLNIISGGNVGIGTTTPNAMLNVGNNSVAAGTQMLNINRGLNSTNNLVFRIIAADNSNRFTIDGEGNTSGGTITSGLINGQTISSAANFTGTLTTADTITVNKYASGVTNAVASFVSNGSGAFSNGVEFGHTNSAGYRGTLGANVSDGKNFLALNSEGGTAANTYRTRGVAGVVYRSNLSGGAEWLTLSSNADNQAGTSIMTLSSAGALGVGAITSTGALNLGANTITSGLINGQTISSAANFTGTVNAVTGYKVNGAATLGNVLRGDGTNFVSSAILPSDSTDWYHSGRDFPSGTIISTSIDYSVTNGDPWVLEIKGNSYGNLIPLDIQYQGYIYSDTIINHGGYSNGTGISGLVALNVGGYLTFWFPTQGYWQGYNVRVYTAYATYATNKVTSITGGAKPTGTKEVALSANIRQSLHTGNVGSYAVSSLAGTANQITASASVGAVTLSIPSDFRAPGTLNAVTSIATGAGAGTTRIDASGNLSNIGTISSGLINGQTINATANFTGTMAIAGNTYIGGSTYGGLSIGETAVNYDGWDRQLTLNGTGHARLTVKTATVRMGMYAHDTWQSVSGVTPGGFVGTYNNYPISFIVNTAQKMVIDTSGNVGIGTTGPLDRLHVSGTSVTNLLRASASADAVSVGGVPNGRYLLSVGGAGDLAWTSGATLTSDVAALLIRPVSIANTSGTGDISMVSISGATSLNPTGASTWGVGLRAGAPAKGGVGTFTNMANLYLEGSPIGGTNNYSLYSDGTAKSYFAGNVGIGTTNPGQKLEVIGNAAVSAGQKFMARYDTSDSYHSSLNWYGLQLGNNGNNYIVGGRTNVGGNLNFVVNNTSDFPTVNGTTALTLASDAKATFASTIQMGNSTSVIGASATSYGTIGLVTSKNGYYGINFGQATAQPTIMYDAAGNGGDYFESAGLWTQYLTRGTNHLNIMTSTDLGYTLGVSGTLGATGAATIGGTLGVTGAVTGGTYNGQTISSTANFTGTVAVATSATSPIIYGGSAVGSTLTLNGTSNGAPASAYVLLNPTNGQNVGIGTANPGSKLDIFTTQGQDGITIDAPTFPQILFKRSTVGKAYIAIAGTANGYGTGTFADSLILRSESGYTHFMNAGTVVGTFSGSKFGLGTTTPTSQLTIQASANTSPILIASSTGATMLSMDTTGALTAKLKQLTYDYTVDSGSSSIAVGDIVSYTGGNVQKGFVGSTGSSTPAASVASSYNAVATLDSTHIVVAYKGTSNTFANAVVGTLSGTSTISWGTPVALNAVGSNFIDVAALDSTHFVVTYYDTASTFTSAVVSSVSGTTITPGTPVALTAQASLSMSTAVAALDSTRFVTFYRNSSPGNGFAVASSVSGTTITAGTPVNVGGNAQSFSITALDSTRFVAMFYDVTPGVAAVRAGSVSGTTITLGAAISNFTSLITPVSIATLDSNRFIAVAGSNGSPNIYANVGTVSGTTITLGSNATLSTNVAGYIGVSVPDPSHFVVAYQNNSSGGYANVIYDNSVVGTTVTAGTNVVANAFSSPYVSIAQVTGSKYAVTYNNGSTNSYPLAFVGSASSNSAVGMAINSANAGGTVAVASTGIVSGLSGLTSGATYYYGIATGLTTSVQTYKVGLALSSSSILLDSGNGAAADQFFGDMIFANAFRITEAADSPQALIFKNQLSRDILSLDENGNVIAEGNLKSKGLNVGAQALFVDEITGNVGIGTTTPVSLLHVLSNSTSTVASFTNSNGTCSIDPTNTALVCSSDERLKTNITTIASSTEMLRKLRGVNFSWKNDQASTTRIGFIAQEVQAVLPELVSIGSDGMLGVNYQNFAPILVNALNNSDVRISELELALASSTASTTASLAMLEQAVQDQGQRISVLEDLMNSSSVFALTATSTATSSPFLASIVEALANVFASMTTYFKDMIVDALTIGKSDKPTGITFYDSVTGEPYCLKITNGVQMTTPGVCVAGALGQGLASTTTTTTTDTSSTTTTTVDTTASTTPITTDTGQGLASTTPTTTDTTASTTPVTTDITASTTPVVVDTTASTTPTDTTTSTTTDTITADTSTTTPII